MFAKMRACLLTLPLALGACGSSDHITSPVDKPGTGELAASPASTPVAFGGTALSSNDAAGMPFGFFRQPTGAVSATYNGAKMTVGPNYVVRTLQETKSRGGRLFLMLADAETFYKDDDGHFSMEKWKARIDRYRNIDFSSYIDDGTIIAHFLIDEPQDKANWNGVPLTGEQLEEMAKYSKQLWPGMATIARAPPAKITWSGTYRYLDAAWAQVENVRGSLNIDQFLEQNVSSARSQGLALAVGLNVTKGGLDKKSMTAGEIESYGAALLSSSYPCAFISWMYDAAYLAKPDIKEAVASLSEKARSRPNSPCRNKSQAPAPVPDDDDDDDGAGSGGNDDGGAAPGGGNDDGGGGGADPGNGDGTGGGGTDPGNGDGDGGGPTGGTGGGDDDGAGSGDDDGAGPGTDNGSGTGGGVVPGNSGGGGVVPGNNGGGVVPGGSAPGPVVGSKISLRLSGWMKAKRPYVVLNWSGAAGAKVDIYRDGRVVYAGVVNDRRVVDTKGLKKRTSYTYKVCERGTSKCSNQAVAALQ